MTFQKILVAIDRSSQAASVFETALEMARQQQAQLMLVHSLPLPELPTAPFLGMGSLADVDTFGTLRQLQQERQQQAIADATAWLKSLADQAPDLSIEWDCKPEDPRHHICTLASSWKATLIVVGRRGHRGLSEVLLGSVSNHILHHAACSVLVVQGQTHLSQATATATAQAES